MPDTRTRREGSPALPRPCRREINCSPAPAMGRMVCPFGTPRTPRASGATFTGQRARLQQRCQGHGLARPGPITRYKSERARQLDLRSSSVGRGRWPGVLPIVRPAVRFRNRGCPDTHKTRGGVLAVVAARIRVPDPELRFDPLAMAPEHVKVSANAAILPVRFAFPAGGRPPARGLLREGWGITMERAATTSKGRSQPLGLTQAVNLPRAANRANVASGANHHGDHRRRT
jgi:hypothetical protein